MYKEVIGAKEINISHDISDKNNMQKERLQDIDNYMKEILELKIEKI